MNTPRHANPAVRTVAEARLLSFAETNPNTPQKVSVEQGLDTVNMRDSKDSWKNTYAYDSVSARLWQYDARVTQLYKTLKEKTGAITGKEELRAGLADPARRLQVYQENVSEETKNGFMNAIYREPDPNGKIWNYRIVRSDSTDEAPALQYQDPAQPGEWKVYGNQEFNQKMISFLIGKYAGWITDQESARFPALNERQSKDIVWEAWNDKSGKYGQYRTTYDQATIDRMSKGESVEGKNPISVFYWNVVEMEKHYPRAENIITDLEKKVAARLGLDAPEKFTQRKELLGEPLAHTLSKERQAALDKQVVAKDDKDKLQTIHLDLYSRPMTQQAQSERDPRFREAAKGLAERYYLLRLPQGVRPSFVRDDGKDSPADTGAKLETITLSGSAQYLKIDKTANIDLSNTLLKLVDGPRTRYASMTRNEFGNLIFTFRPEKETRTRMERPVKIKERVTEDPPELGVTEANPPMRKPMSTRPLPEITPQTRPLSTREFRVFPQPDQK